jgi:hypothetical protein
MPLFVLLASFPAWGGTKWTQPTADELKMTADPAAPGAAAVYLNLEETTNEVGGHHTFYARIKVLTEDGKKYGDVTIPYLDQEENIHGVEGRTIHSDGTVVPFTGKPWQKLVVKGAGIRRMEKGFSLRDVQVGSILEYRYETTYYGFRPPRWYLQQVLYVHQEHFHYDPSQLLPGMSTQFLPRGVQMTGSGWKGWDLRVSDIPPQVEEDDSPPVHSMGYRVMFYYMITPVKSYGDFWKAQGAIWSGGVDAYAAPEKLKEAVAQLTEPGDTDRQKLEKIYAAVMGMDNTSFSREHTQAEDKVQKAKAENTTDIWAKRRGNQEEIALVFIGLARAAGLKAYAMAVTNRDENAFVVQQADWSQLDDTIAIVNVGGKEMYFDPGERYCAFGELHWKHTWTAGVRQLDGGTTAIAQTPYPVFSATKTERDADLHLDSDGGVKGTIRIEMTGSVALRWRQEALVSDEEQTKKEFTDGLQAELPAGLTVKMDGLSALTDYTVPLVANLEVSGNMGTRTGKRMFLPGTFFEAQAKPRFVNAVRQNPVYLPYPYSVHDKVKLALPAMATLEMMPKTQEIKFSPYAGLSSAYGMADKGRYAYERLEAVNGLFYETKDYPQLRDFFQRVNTQDQAQVVLVTAPAVAAAAVGGSQ